MTNTAGECCIHAVHIDGFGPFHDQRIDFGPGLVIVEGPNEAGKTGLLQFLMYSLFPERGDGQLKALAGGRLGGRVFLGAGGRQLTVERYGRDAPALWEGGRRVDGGAGIQGVMGGVDRGLFGRVYAFSPAELLTLDSLGDEGVRERLFAGAVAGAGRDVQKAMAALKARREQLWRQRGGCRMREIDTDAGEIKRRLETARMRIADLAAERGRLGTIREELQVLDKQRLELNAEMARVKAARQAWPVLVELRVEDARRAELEALGVPTIELHRRAGVLLSREAELRREVDAGAREVADKDRELARLSVDEALLAVGAEARLLEAEKAEVLVLAADVAELRPTIERRKRALDANVAAAGLGAGADALAEVRGGPTFAAALRRAAADVERVEAVLPALEHAQAELRREEALLGEARAAIVTEGAVAAEVMAGATSVAAVPDVSEAVQVKVAMLRQARTAVMRRDALIAIEMNADGQRMARWLMALGILAIVAIVGFAVGTEGGVGPGGVVGVATGVILLFLAVVLAKVGKQRIAEAAAQRVQVVEPIKIAGFAVDVDAATVSDGLDAAMDMLRRAEVAAAAGGSRAVNEKARLEARLGEAERTTAWAREKVERLAAEKRQLEHAAAAWGAALVDAALPAALPAGGVEAILREVEAGQKELREINLLRERVEAGQARVAVWMARARGLLVPTGRAVADVVRAMASAIAETVERCAVAEDRKAKANELKLARQRLAEGLLDVEGELARVQDALLETARAAGVDDIAGWLERFEQHRRVVAACEDRRLTLKRILGDAEDAVAAIEDSDPVTREVRFEAADADLKGLERQREALLDERGRLTQRLGEVAHDAEIADLEQGLAALVSERETLAAELVELMLAEDLLKAALAAFREKHEPGVFRVAAEHMRTATAGVWVGVHATDDQRELTVIDAAGRARESAVLSRGTRDLLYIALRLGLAHEQRPGGLLLPLVLDDVLVNLDPERAQGLARVLAAEAKQRQVMVLTCRPETVAALSEADATATIVRLARWAGATGPPAGGVVKAPMEEVGDIAGVSTETPKKRGRKAG